MIYVIYRRPIQKRIKKYNLNKIFNQFSNTINLKIIKKSNICLLRTLMMVKKSMKNQVVHIILVRSNILISLKILFKINFMHSIRREINKWISIENFKSKIN
jgi:hypothetical protein